MKGHKKQFDAPVPQVAAIPFKLTDDGELQVMLITSRTTKRFIVPKGWPMKRKSGRKMAAIEARKRLPRH